METSVTPITRVWQKIELIAEISAACRRLQPEAPAFEELLRLVQTVVPFDVATLYLREPDSGRFTARATVQEEVPPPESLIERDTVHRDCWRPGSRNPVVCSDDSGPGSRPGQVLATIMFLPLVIDDDLTGLLNLGSYTPGVLEQRQLQLMTVVADQLAVSIERLEHIAKIEAQNEALRQAQQQLRLSQEKRIAEEKLAAAAELAASINHRINNPLSVVVGNIDCLLIEERELSVKARERLKRVVTAALKIGETNRCLLNIRSLVNEAAQSARIDSTQDQAATIEF